MLLTTTLGVTACGQGASVLDEKVDGAGKGDLWHANRVVHMPFESGTTITLSQVFHGDLSHNGTQAYAVDFPIPIGTTVLAARSGRVIATRSDSSTGCGIAACAVDANYIIIDHGDGTLGRYYHLQTNGVDVAVGDSVCRGTPIGRSGNTGFSTGPHLHFDIVNVHGETIPVQFSELAEAQLADGADSISGRRLHGVPFPGAEITSDNSFGSCEPVEPASCDDAFIHVGIRLLDETPCSVASYDDPRPLSGQMFGSGDRVQIGQLLGPLRSPTATPPPPPEWTYTCIPVTRAPGDLHATFSTTLTWPRQAYGSARSAHLMVHSARSTPGGGCKADWGWSQSAEVYFAE
ncbi:MAG: M23 family metallopeptidase [Kofleriaceae bacterium]